MIKSHKIALLIFTFCLSLTSCKKGHDETIEDTTPFTEETVQVKPDKIVAKDGTGDYTTVQAAVDAAPVNATKPYVIAIKNGIYKEVITVPKLKNFLHFQGEDIDKTVLTFDNYAKRLDGNGVEFGTSGSASVFIKATNFKASNLTIQNTAGIDAGQALAINIGGDLAAFSRCKFLGFQDTYYAADQTTQYLKDCYIAGTVDYMFGGSTALFDNCTIHSLRDGYVTAASTPAGKKYGYVYLNCKLTGVSGTATVYLGRPWRPNANVVFVNCTMAAHIRPEGWNNWGNTANEATAFYAEYKSTGPGYQAGKRVAWSKQLTDTELKEYTVEKILGTWKPF
ncbi:pectin esterase [Pedobacter sp. PACM 27299]|uniref:pectinesterase family protein n=1 Tax=Pedobacter sp. PACM 27299 TaxID=1727164 RepID=UPI0007058D91|nr:pectinesterase family protein [Pedobacter sp. PACM 27299]ALL06480.1 pectin esterase [Pedobacter sp. PACM 27299]